MRTEFLCICVLRVASGPRVKLASCKSALNPLLFTLLVVLVLLLCGLFYEAIFLCPALCHFVLVFFSPFSIAITSLGEERANLSAFRTLVRFVLVWICRFPLPLGVWEGLRFVIVALPGLLSYLLLTLSMLDKHFRDLSCVILFLCFSVLLALRLPRLGKRELILVFFVRLFDLCLFGCVCFLFLLVSGKGCGL